MRSRRCRTKSTTTVAMIAASAGRQARAMYSCVPMPNDENRCSAMRLDRLDTGSSKEAVLASHTVVRANGIAGMPSCRVMAMTTGVSSTAVVSMLSTIVQAVASATTRSHNSQVRCRPACEVQ